MGCAVLLAPAVLSQAVIIAQTARCVRCAGLTAPSARGGQNTTTEVMPSEDIPLPR